MHCDMGTNLYERTLKGEKNIFKACHYDNLRKGDCKLVFMACFFSGEQDWKTMQDMILNCNKEINDNLDCLRQVKCKEDLIEDEKILGLISVEGMCGVTDDFGQRIEWMYEHGIRVASLVWNESNALADGWPNDPRRGLSKHGFDVIKKMNELNMIVDVSHINECGFWDIVNASTRPIIATHSNARRLCGHDRNLTDQQIKAIASTGGIIGLNSCGDFINEVSSEQTSLNLARHAKYMADLVGVEHIACGFDYMDFLDEYDGSGQGGNENAIDLVNAGDSQNLINSLYEVGFNDDEVSKIAYYNVHNFLKEQL